MKDYDKNKESSYFKYSDVNFIWMGNIEKASSKWFWVDRRCF